VIFLLGYVHVPRFHSEEDVDYSKYLGADWRKNKFKGKRVSTVVGNHYSFIDMALVLLKPDMKAINPTFTPMA